MNRGIVTLNDITNGLINVNIMEVQIVNSKKWLSTGAIQVLVHWLYNTASYALSIVDTMGLTLLIQ